MTISSGSSIPFADWMAATVVPKRWAMSANVSPSTMVYVVGGGGVGAGVGAAVGAGVAVGSGVGVMIGVAVGDVSGKGVQAASRTAMAVHSPRAFALPGASPLASRLLKHPLARSAGGDYFHGGGQHWQSQNDPEWQIMAAW